MQGNMPVKADDKPFQIDGWQFYVGVWGDEFYTTAKLVVEATKGGGQYGDPKVAGPTWRELASKQTDTDVGNKLTDAQRAEFLEQFRTQANTALAAWVKANGSGTGTGTLPEIPKDFWGWLRWHFLYRVTFNSATNQLVI